MEAALLCFAFTSIVNSHCRRRGGITTVAAAIALFLSCACMRAQAWAPSGPLMGLRTHAPMIRQARPSAFSDVPKPLTGAQPKGCALTHNGGCVGPSEDV